jgi:general secretion pathway protein I
MSKCREASDSGFTLIEVLVSLTILSISLVVLLHVFSDSLHRAHESKMEMTAGALAQSLLSDAGASMPLHDGDITGKTSDGFSWRLHAEPYGSEEDRRSWPMGALTITASVDWLDGSTQKSVTLTTLRAVPKETGQ